MNLRKIQSNCALYCTSVLHASALGALLCLGDWVVGYAAICSHCSSRPSGQHVVDCVREGINKKKALFVVFLHFRRPPPPPFL